MAKIQIDRSVIVGSNEPTGIILDHDRKGSVVYGFRHEGVKAMAFLTPEEAELQGLRLIQFAAVARSVQAESDKTVNGSPIV